MRRSRINVFLERDHAARLDELATMKRMSKSAMIAAALAAYLSIPLRSGAFGAAERGGKN